MHTTRLLLCMCPYTTICPHTTTTICVIILQEESVMHTTRFSRMMASIFVQGAVKSHSSSKFSSKVSSKVAVKVAVKSLTRIFVRLYCCFTDAFVLLLGGECDAYDTFESYDGQYLDQHRSTYFCMCVFRLLYI